MGSVSGLFTRLLGDNPSENQLTEALASVCERSETFRARLLERLLGESVHGVRVATQSVHYLDPGRPPKVTAGRLACRHRSEQP